MLHLLKVENPHDKRLLRVLILICIFEFYFAYGREIELVHGRHEILVLVGAATGRCVWELHDLEDWPVETLGAVVTLGFAHSVVKCILDIR
jgi:hypothetical protein